MSNRIAELDAEIEHTEARLKVLREDRQAAHLAEQRAKPLLERLIFAAAARCHCGAGLAYDPASDGEPPFKGPSKWECSDILLFKTYEEERKAGVKAATHDEGFPFAFYEIKSENQPSARGATTRPA